MFVREYVSTRRAAGLLQGLPFVISMLLLGVLIGVSHFELRDTTTALQERLQTALADEDTEAAKRLVRQLRRDQPNNEFLAFQAGRLEWGGPQHDAAYRQLFQLAVRAQYGPAAAFLIEKDAEAREEELQHLETMQDRLAVVEVAVRRYPKDYRYAALQADLLLADDRSEEAIAILEPLADIDPVRSLQLALVLRKQGDPAAARQYAHAGIALLDKRDSDDVSVSNQLLRAALNQLLENWEEVFRTLQPTQDLSAEDQQQLRRAHARALVSYSRHQQDTLKPDEAVKQGFVHLSQAVRLAPNDPQIIGAVSSWLAEHADADESQLAMLQDAVAQGMSPEFSHFILGTTLVLRGEGQKAAVHLELAQEQFPTSPAILNNLAFTLATQEEPDLPRALQIVEVALEQSPDHAFIRDTRGQILIKMEDYKRAIPDLEFALREPRLQVEAHRSLAVAYEALGQQAIADRHRKLAKEKE